MPIRIFPLLIKDFFSGISQKMCFFLFAQTCLLEVFSLWHKICCHFNYLLEI